jgi:hypothetical protein
MSETTRELIIQAFAARASSMTIANGYPLNIGATVIRGIKEVDPSLLPATSIFPQPETAVPSGSGEYIITMPVRVEAIDFYGTTNPSVVGEVLLGILRAGYMKSALSDLIDTIQYSAGGVDEYPDANQCTIGASATFIVTYFSNINNPY